jgi:hypothetical protein
MHPSDIIRRSLDLAFQQCPSTAERTTQRSAALGQWAVQDQTAAIDPEPRCSRSGANLRIESVRTPSPRFRTKSLAAAKTSVMH